MGAKKGLELDSSSTALQELLKQAQTETKEPLEVQRHMHQLREQKRQDAKLQDLMRGLNMGGNNIQMFSPGDDLNGFLNGLKGGGGGFGGGSGFGGGKSRMTEDQMRAMARAMAQNPNAQNPNATTSEDAQPAGPTTFAPQ